MITISFVYNLGDCSQIAYANIASNPVTKEVLCKILRHMLCIIFQHYASFVAKDYAFWCMIVQSINVVESRKKSLYAAQRG